MTIIDAEVKLSIDSCISDQSLIMLENNSNIGNNNSQLFVIGIIVFLDMIGYGIILPVMPQLIHDISGTSIDRSAEIGGFLLFVYAVMQFLFAPLIGSLSDRFGRRPVLLTTLALLAIDYAIMAVAPTLGWLAAGRAISGIMGATWAAAYASIADCVSFENRGRAFGILGGAGAAGFVFGPALGGIVGEFGTRLPFIAAALLVGAGLLIGLIALRETLPAKSRREFKLARANPIGAILRMARVPLVLPCLTTVFLMNLASQAQLSIWPYWGELRFGWQPLTSGLTVSLYGVLLGMVQALTTGWCVARFGAVRTAWYGLLFGLPSYLMLAFAPSTPFVILAIIVGACTGIAFPALQSLMTTKVAEDAQGELQGAISSTISSSAIAGPILMTQIFGLFTDSNGVFFPGAPYILAFCVLISTILLFRRAIVSAAEK
jgi:MFS transporter, DHA1 family, tetracycline resistance protein